MNDHPDDTPRLLPIVNADGIHDAAPQPNIFLGIGLKLVGPFAPGEGSWPDPKLRLNARDWRDRNP